MPNSRKSPPPDYTKLLDWLSDDPAAAEKIFHRIRSELIRILGSRGCRAPEDLADETIDRVARKVEGIVGDYTGNPALYFYAVARNVFKEYLRRPRTEAIEDGDGKGAIEALPVNSSVADTSTDELECLDSCLAVLQKSDHRLILDYYTRERAEKIRVRESLAKRLGLGMNALRIKAYRIRKRLFECVTDCMKMVPA